MSSEKKPKPVAWRYCLLMRDSMGGWERKIEPTDPRTLSYIRQERLRDVEPLYSEATIEALRAERDEARKDIEAFWKPQFDEQVERAETAEARMAQLEAERGAFREALEPFAKMADHIDNLGHEPGSTSLHRLKANDLRRARALLSDGGDRG